MSAIPPTFTQDTVFSILLSWEEWYTFWDYTKRSHGLSISVSHSNSYVACTANFRICPHSLVALYSKHPYIHFSHLAILFTWMLTVINFASNERVGLVDICQAGVGAKNNSRQTAWNIGFNHPQHPKDFYTWLLCGKAKSLHSSSFVIFITLASGFSSKIWNVSYWQCLDTESCAQGGKCKFG